MLDLIVWVSLVCKLRVVNQIEQWNPLKQTEDRLGILVSKLLFLHCNSCDICWCWNKLKVFQCKNKVETHRKNWYQKQASVGPVLVIVQEAALSIWLCFSCDHCEHLNQLIQKFNRIKSKSSNSAKTNLFFHFRTTSF